MDNIVFDLSDWRECREQTRNLPEKDFQEALAEVQRLGGDVELLLRWRGQK